MNISRCTMLAVLAFSAFATCSCSYGDIEDARITELWVGRSGPDGTRDWLEVTNTGDTPINTSDLAYDDVNPTLDTAFVLPALLLQPGESFVFLIDIDADNPVKFPNSSIEEFLEVWDPFDGLIGTGQADGGLSQNGDSANLLNVATGAVIDSITYTNANIADATIERIGDGPTDIRSSVLGENGAYEAMEFVDENCETVLNDDNEPVVLIGSPGIYMLDKFVLGDVNCDGVVDLLDVQPFVILVTSGEFSAKADINGDGVVNLLDVQPFVELLTG